ncbi:MAG: carboxypeptidase [Maricaulaceae bacterium]|nr:carboxypeptidase [Maricaulaceae bacterium]
MTTPREISRNWTGLIAPFALAIGLFACGAGSQEPPPALPDPAPSPLDAAYDPAVPILPYAFGEEITTPEAAVAYVRELAAFAPERMRVFDYAESWQGRPLVYAVIGSEANIARLDEIQRNLAQLADPRGFPAAERDRLIAETPPVVWLSYSVHGDEITPVDSGLWTAYHLLAARGDAVAEAILDNVLVVIDPAQNPDGRARFVHSFESAHGLQPDPLRFAAEHDQPWPGGRFNHYLFDMNRDWFVMTQPETQGRVRAMLNWFPVVVVDSHEMGGDSSYYFAPAAEPFNPQLSTGQRAAQDLIGRNNARWFDRMGFAYFTREVFDAFYPGYGDMWPALHGAIAMTYEQGSPRGLVWRRMDGSELTYADGVTQNFIASLSTAEIVAHNRERFLRDFMEYRAAAASDRSGPRAFVFGGGVNRWGAERLARLLAAQGIEVSRFSTAGRVCGLDVDGEAFIVDAAQPAGRLARALLATDIPLPRDFMAEQERRRAAGLGHELYDITAWSLPVMFNTGLGQCAGAPPRMDATPVDPAAPIAPRLDVDDAAFGYAIPWTDGGQAALAAALLAEGVAARTSNLDFRIGNRVFPRGTVIVPRAGAPENLDAIVRRHAESIGAEAVSLASSWVDEGPNFGSDNVRPMRAPRIAMAWDEGVSPISAGAARFILERRYGLPVTVIRTRTLTRADLSGFDVVILPDTRGPGYASALGSGGAAALRRFAEGGGVLVALGGGARWLADPCVDLIPLRRERAAGSAEPPPAAAGCNESSGGGGRPGVVTGSEIADVAALAAAMAPRGAMPDSEPGALLRLEADPDAWLSAGFQNGAAALAHGADIYAPVPRGEAVTALRFAGPDNLVAAGHVWAENRRQFAFKPYAISRSLGAGQVVAITHDPAARAFQEGLDLLLLNAVLLGPAQSGRLR